MKKTALATALLLVTGASQSATLEPNATYEMEILADGISCFNFDQDCALDSSKAFIDNDNDATATNGSSIDGDGLAGIINITTTSDNANGVDFTVNSFNMDTYLGTAGGAFGTWATDVSQMTGSIDVNGNITFIPTNRLGVAQFYTNSLGEQPWNLSTNDSAKSATLPACIAAQTGLYTPFTTGSMSAIDCFDGTTLVTMTGTPLDNNNNAIIVSATNIGTSWGFFEGTPYTEKFSLNFVLKALARPDAYDIDQQTTNNIRSVLDNDLPATGMTIASIDTTATQGTVTITGASTTLTYTPPVDVTLTSDTITYTITDGNNTSTSNVTITLIDTILPVIVLRGPDPQGVANGSTFVEQEADCTDNFDADKLATVGGQTVNTGIDGDYLVTYNCTDLAGNAAVEVTRTVTVSTANQAPSITVSGPDPLNYTVTPSSPSSFTEAVANSDVICTDDSGTPLLSNDAPLQVLNASILGGPYTITYNCIDTDSTPLSAPPVERVVNVVDNVDPVVTATGLNPTFVVVGNIYTELGATCTDNYDASPVIDISPTADAVDTSVIGNTTTITYTCTDSSNNTDVATIDVVTISTGPVITLNGDNPVAVFLGGTYTENGAVCSDDVDGNKAALISGDTVDTAVASTYTVLYNCTDSDGNDATEVTRTVTVSADTEAPVITLNGDDEINLNVGFTYFEEDAVCSDNADEDKDATISGDTVDITTAGSYDVRYNCTDSAGNTATEVTRTVTIKAVSGSDTDTSNPDVDDEIGSVNGWILAGLIGLLATARRRKA